MNKLLKHRIEWLRSRLISELIPSSTYKNLSIAATNGEIAIAQSVFGELIYYSEVKIFNIPFLPWQPENIFIAPNGNLYVSSKIF